MKTQKFQLDKNLDKYVLIMENPITNKAGKVIGNRTWKDVINKEDMNDIIELLNDQEKQISQGLETTNQEIAKLPKLSKRERDALRELNTKFQKIQALNQLEKHEANRKSQEDALSKIQKDIKELKDAI